MSHKIAIFRDIVTFLGPKKPKFFEKTRKFFEKFFEKKYFCEKFFRNFFFRNILDFIRIFSEKIDFLSRKIDIVTENREKS